MDSAPGCFFFDESVNPFCRDIARQVRKDIPVVHGWCWSSVHDSEATAVMFFEVRIGETDLELKGMRFVNDDPSLLEELRQTASRVGVSISR